MNTATTGPVPALPVLPQPDLAWLQGLLETHAIPARVSPWTRVHLQSHTQTGAGAYVWPHFAGPEYRDEVVNLLVNEGYTIEADGGCVTVEFPPDRW